MDENESTASSDLSAFSSNEKETMNCFVNDAVLMMNPNIGQEGLTRSQSENVVDTFCNYSENGRSQEEICMTATEETSDTNTGMHSNVALKELPESNPLQGGCKITRSQSRSSRVSTLLHVMWHTQNNE
jgi:hypothetical protein